MWGQDAPLDSQKIAAAIGGEADAVGVFSAVFEHMRKPTGASRRTNEVFLRSQIRPECLPDIYRVDFVLMTGAEADTLTQKCGLYWLVTSVTRVDNAVTVLLSQHCGGTVLEYPVWLDTDGWRVGRPGTPNNGFTGLFYA